MSDRPTPETDHCISERRRVHNINGFAQVLELVNANLARKLERERDEAREIVRNFYSVSCELKRFVSAYAGNYDEVDGKDGALQAIADFHSASKNIAKIIGEEEAAK